MVKVFYFGKHDFEGKGKANSVEIEICLQDKKDGKVFTASGTVWNRTHKDCIMGGQCLDDIANNCEEIANDATFKKIYKFWKLYHLNDMHPGTKEQEKFIAKHQEELKNFLKSKIGCYLAVCGRGDKLCEKYHNCQNRRQKINI